MKFFRFIQEHHGQTQNQRRNQKEVCDDGGRAWGEGSVSQVSEIGLKCAPRSPCVKSLVPCCCEVSSVLYR